MRVVVIGGGAIGLLCAYHLTRRGAKVILIDRDRVGGACSSGNAGWVTPSISNPLPSPQVRWSALGSMVRPDSPLYIKPSAMPRLAGFLLSFWKHCNADDFHRGTRAMADLNRETMILFDELEADGVRFEWADKGLLMVFRDTKSMAEELDMLRDHDYGPLRTLPGDEVLDMEPSLAPGVAGGIHVLPERTVRPEQMCAAVAGRLRLDSVEILEEATVESLRLRGRQAEYAVLASEEIIEADAFLIATGADAATLSRQCGSPLPLTSGKGYSITVNGPRTQVRYPLYLAAAKVGVTPFEGALRIAGTMELSGINLRLDPRRLASLKRVAEKEVPGVAEGDETVDWVGGRPLTPDGLPILGALPSTDNVFVATGHQMLGITLAPATGKVMAKRILGTVSTVDLSPFDPARFFRR